MSSRINGTWSTFCMRESFLETRHDFQVCALLVVSYSVTSHCFGPGLLSWAFHENKREKWNGAFLLCLRLSKNTLDLFSLLHTLRNAEREWREAWEGAERHFLLGSQQYPDNTVWMPWNTACFSPWSWPVMVIATNVYSLWRVLFSVG